MLQIVAVVSADERYAFFEKRIRPVLVQYCYECHSAAAAEIGGELRLDSRPGARQGGESGPAVVPGDPDASLLLDAIRHRSRQMPPEEKLPEQVIADFETWIAADAFDPRDTPPSRAEAADSSWELTLAARRDWWSLLPAQDPPVPVVNELGPSPHPIDAFLRFRLAEAGLLPSGPADPYTLIRRLSLTLIGLPPSPDETRAYVADHAQDPEAAVTRLVDRLLASPHFGERWARHWMDVVRFTETHGNEWNYEVHHAWRYRDYLIRAYNADVPYDQLVREHLAGDLLDPPRRNASERFNESVIGTAFFRFGEAPHDDCIGLRKIGYDITDNQLDTLGKAFQAATIACARCHDHKLDAISQADYYALTGILRSSRLVAHTIDDPVVNAEKIQQLVRLKAEIRQELAEAWRQQLVRAADYLLAADAAKRSLPAADSLAAGLEQGVIDRWISAFGEQETPLPWESPLAPWTMWVHRLSDGHNPSEAWQQVRVAHGEEQQARAEFNAANFVTWGDFGSGDCDTWQLSGQGLRPGQPASGHEILASTGDQILKAIHPSGCYTYQLSERLNGAVRSPPLPVGKRKISLEVMGRYSAAVRLVSNNCQLNYANYRALAGDAMGWVTFQIPHDAESLRVYAEVMTKFDNPKFPDQLAGLGGDSGNHRVPWQQAAADPRSYFGIRRVVLHDCNETPKQEIRFLAPLWSDERSPREDADVAARYATVIAAAVESWGQGAATDDQIPWLQWLLHHQLVDHSLQVTEKLEQLVSSYRHVEASLALPRIVPGVADAGAGRDQRLLAGGDHAQPGRTVPRRYLEVLAGPSVSTVALGSGRKELAEQIATAQNPLTARVMVNRVWHHLFGTGIVKSVDDFGSVGELPSHPELLDHLATKFTTPVGSMAGHAGEGLGWSIKGLIRYIVLAHAFRQQGVIGSRTTEPDPHNRWLQYYPGRRMEAETIRDVILATSGHLDRSLYGLSVHPFREKANEKRRLFPGPLDGQGRRSIYIKVNLMEAAKFLSAFNTPGGKVARGRRDRTNVPTQALALLNDPFVIQQAGIWADWCRATPTPVPARIEQMLFRGLGRPAQRDEVSQFVEFVDQLAELHGVNADEIIASSAVWSDVAHTVFNLKEFTYIP